MKTSEMVNKYGSPVVGLVQEFNDKRGTGKHTYVSACSRCGGAGGAEKWKHTGFTCYDCGGSGNGPIKVETVYTPEAYAKYAATQAKRAESAALRRAAKLAAKAEETAKANAERWARFSAEFPGIVVAMNEHAGKDRILDDLRDSATLHGGLSERQRELFASRVAAIAARAGSDYLDAKTGDRITLRLTVEKIFFGTSDGRSRFAPSSLHLCRDDRGNRIVYRGSGFIGAAGDTNTIKATVCGFDEYAGEKQTLIERPKMEKSK